MENLAGFLSIGYSDGPGDGCGFCYGTGDGYGSGSYSDGPGDGCGFGSGDGSGYGYGYGYGLKQINGNLVHDIDGVQTIIKSIKGNVAKGSMVNADLTQTPCFIVKIDGHFAHGETLKQAREDALGKAMEAMPIEELIEEFHKIFEKGKKYKAKDFFDWHGRLTGSCLMGRQQFVKDRQINLDSKITVAEFVKLSTGQYGSEIIAQLN